MIGVPDALATSSFLSLLKSVIDAALASWEKAVKSNAKNSIKTTANFLEKVEFIAKTKYLK